MSKSAFLKQFITEDVYVIDKSNDTEVLDKKKEVEILEEPSTEYADEKVVEKTPPIPEKAALIYKGANKKGITIIVNYPNQEYIDVEDEAFLLKILSAVKLTADDVAIINMAKNEHLNDFKILDSATCIIFDEKSHLTDNLNPYAITNKEDINLLWGATLSVIAKDNAQKKQLWEALQKLFLK